MTFIWLKSDTTIIKINKQIQIENILKCFTYLWKYQQNFIIQTFEKVLRKNEYKFCSRIYFLYTFISGVFTFYVLCSFTEFQILPLHSRALSILHHGIYTHHHTSLLHTVKLFILMCKITSYVSLFKFIAFKFTKGGHRILLCYFNLLLENAIVGT